MENSNEKLRNTFDRVIGEKPLVSSKEKANFYRRLEDEKRPVRRKHWIPRIATAFLFTVAAVFALIFLPLDNAPLDDTGNGNPHTQVPPEKSNETIIPSDEVIDKIEEIKSTFRVDMTMEEVQDIFGEGYYYTGDSETDSRTFEALEYLYFTNVKKEQGHHPFMEGMEPYKNGEVGLNFNIIWYENSRPYAFINYLDGKSLATVSFRSDGKVFDNDRFIGNALYDIPGSGFLVERIAESLNKTPSDVTESDLQYVEELTLQSSMDGPGFIELFPFDMDVLKRMVNLKALHVNQVGITYEEIASLSAIENLKLENIIKSDLAAFQQLKKLKQLDIANTDILTVAHLVGHPSLEVVILNKEHVNDWELLEEEGIQVIDKGEK